MAMQVWWILPNRDQRDEILASDGEKTLPLREVLDPKLRPEGFSHGVPAELLEKYAGKEQEILFAQKFPEWNGERQLFLVSAPAGVDASDRVVHVGLLFILEENERPRFDRLPTGLTGEDHKYARALVRRMTSGETSDLWARSVRELAAMPVGKPATNVALDRSAVRFDSMYTAEPDGPAKKSGTRRRQTMTASVVLVLCAAAGAWLFERGCDQSFHPSARTGVSIWHLS